MRDINGCIDATWSGDHINEYCF